MARLQDKVAVITGAGSGIGRASAEMFAQEGAVVVVTDLRREAAEETVAAITAAGGQAMGLAVDVGDESQLRQMIETTVEAYGRIDVLYNNALSNNPAMSARDRDFLQFDPDVFFNAMRINVLGGVLASKFAVPHMLSKGTGSIIFTSSTSSLGGDVTAYSYGPSKAALNWYVQSIAATFGKQGVRCNAILPGVIQTASQKAWSNPTMDDAFLDIHNVPRLGLPDDIAAAALYLASDESRYTNGTLMRVDGGMSCTVPFVSVVRKFLKKS